MSVFRRMGVAAGVVLLPGVVALAGAQEASAPASELRSWMPESLRGERLFALEYWQWLGLFLVVFAGVVVDHGVRWILRFLSNRFIVRYHASADEETVQRAVRPVGLVAAALVWIGALHLLALPEDALVVLRVAAGAFAVFSGTWAGWRITDLAAETLGSVAARTDSKLDDVLIPLIRKAVKVFIVVFGLIYLADTLNIEIAPLLAGLGIGGLAFAFAAKDTIENFFGSIAVLIDRPFAVGDWIVLGDVDGTVEEIGFRSTRIRTFYNSQITVPNAELVRAKVDNYGRRKYRRFKQMVSIQYDTPPDRIAAFCAGIREIIRAHPYTRKDYYHVWLNQFSASSLDVLLYTFFETPDWATELRERHRLMLDVVRLADRLDVKFAFPTQTIHLYREEHGIPHEPRSAPARDEDRLAEESGRHAAAELVRRQSWRREKPEPVRFDEGPLTAGFDDSETE